MQMIHYLFVVGYNLKRMIYAVVILTPVGGNFQNCKEIWGGGEKKEEKDVSGKITFPQSL